MRLLRRLCLCQLPAGRPRGYFPSLLKPTSQRELWLAAKGSKEECCLWWCMAGEKRNQTLRGRGRFFLRFLLMVPVAKGEGRGNCAIEISRYRLEICRFHFFLLDSQIGEKLTYVEEKASHSFGKCREKTYLFARVYNNNQNGVIVSIFDAFK